MLTVFDFLGKEPGCSPGVKPIPQDSVGEEGTHPTLMKKGWRPAAMGVPSAGLSQTERGAISPLAPMPGTRDKAPRRLRHTLTVLGAKNDSVGTDWQSREGEKGSARGQETASPRGRLGPTESQRVQWVGREHGQTEGTEKCTLGENAQNLRHQTDEEVAIWGQRSTGEAPREASRDTSQSSTCLAHSSHLQTPSAQRSKMTM